MFSSIKNVCWLHFQHLLYIIQEFPIVEKNNYKTKVFETSTTDSSKEFQPLAI